MNKQILLTIPIIAILMMSFALASPQFKVNGDGGKVIALNSYTSLTAKYISFYGSHASISELSYYSLVVNTDKVILDLTFRETSAIDYGNVIAIKGTLMRGSIQEGGTLKQLRNEEVRILIYKYTNRGVIFGSGDVNFVISNINTRISKA